MTYEALIKKRGALKGLANKSKYKETQQEIQHISRALRESTRKLCRNLKENPNVSGNLLKIQEKRQLLCDLLQRIMEEIEKQGKQNRSLSRRVHGLGMGHMGCN